MSKFNKNFKGVHRRNKKAIPKIDASPNHICFKDYEDGDEITKIIELKNLEMKSYHLSINFENTDILQLSIVGDSSKTILDCNESLVLEVKFTPKVSYKKSTIDLRYDIRVNIINGIANLNIPILVISSNPSVNFPKEIYLPDTSINSPTYSNIFILNYTNNFYKFSFDSRNEIKILPDCKVIALKPGDGAIYTVELIPKVLGMLREKITICFDGGKKTVIFIKCNVIPLNISLSDEIIEFTPTHVGLMDTKSINIINNSEEMTLFELQPIECIQKRQSDSNHISKKFLQFSPQSGELQPNSITKIYVVFKPEDLSDDDKDLPKEILFTYALKLSFDINYHPTFQILGKILGPSFQLDRNHIDIGTLYLGESRYIDIKVTNVGIIDGKIFFLKTPSSFDGIVKVSSKCETITMSESKAFKIKFLAKRIGKFIEQAFFKIKNGDRLLFTLEGLIKPLQVYYHPHTIDFPSSSICVPQLKTFLVKNELPFDIRITIDIENNGNENPLEFSEFFKSQISEVDSTVSEESTSKCSLESGESSVISSSELTRSTIKSFLDQHGYLHDMTSNGIKTIFNKVNDFLFNNEIAKNVVQNLMDEGVNLGIENLYVVEMMLEIIMEKVKDADYDISGCNKFHEKSWKIPQNPREIDCDKSSFLISSNNSVEIKIFHTPNFIGKFTKNLKLLVEMACVKNINDKTIINIPINTYCQSSQLKIFDQTKEVECYAENEIQIDVTVENVTDFHGFYWIEKLCDKEMDIRCGEEKFHIMPASKKSLKLFVRPLKSGEILKCINIVALGSNKKFPIYIDCKSLPPYVVIKPGRICEKEMEVLVRHDSFLILENRSNTKSRFFAKLENDLLGLDIYPRGGILSSKQSVMITIEKIFHDPGDYNDDLIVEIVNYKTFKIPIKCAVKKLPILIEPPIAKVFDFGSLFISKKPYYIQYSFTNGGKRSYIIFITLKNKRNRQEEHFLIEPNRFELNSNESRVVKILLNTTQPITIEEDFTIEGCSSQFPLREIMWEGKLKASVIKPSVMFSTNEIVFSCYYGQSDDLYENIKVTNNSPLPLSLIIKIEGEFYVKGAMEFELGKNETLKLTIGFSSKLLNTSNTFCTFKGKVKAFSFGKLLCSANLIGHLIFPDIVLSNQRIIMTSHPPFPCAVTLKLKNPSSVLSSPFELNFKEKSTLISPVFEQRQSNLVNVIEKVMHQKTNLREKFFNYSCFDEIDEDFELNDDFDEIECKKLTEDRDLRETQKISNEKIREIISKKYNIEATIKDIKKLLSPLVNNKGENERLSSHNFSLVQNIKNKNFLSLSQKKGVLKPKEERLISIWFSGCEKSFKLTSELICKTIGGIDQEFSLCLYNDKPNFLITKLNFDISSPLQQQQQSLSCWHKIITNNVTVSTMNQTPITVKLIGAKKSDINIEELLEGYVKHNKKSSTEFILNKDQNFLVNVRFSIFCGCQMDFRNEFGIQVNDMPPIPITFYAHNPMPMATLLNIDRKSLYEIDKTFEYDCLREFFNQVVDKIFVKEEKVDVDEMQRFSEAKAEIEANVPQKVQRKSTKKIDKKSSMKAHENDNRKPAIGDNNTQVPKEFGYFYGENGRVLWREKFYISSTAKFQMLIDKDIEEENFVVLDYPTEYPQQTEITRFISQHGLTKSLLTDEEILSSYKDVYNYYVVGKFKQSKRSIGACSDEFIVTPLPLIIHNYTIDMGEVTLNSDYEQVFQIFIQCDKLSAAIRSEVKIPNFSMSFLQNSEINNYLITNYKNEFNGKYRNRHHRKLTDESHLKYQVKSCHSFDFTTGKVHARNTETNRNEINRIYNEKMSTSIKIEESPLLLSKIFGDFNSISSQGVDAKLIEVKIKFSPKFEHFDDDMVFDEIIYVDIHLGPQIPINLTGKIVSQKLKLSTE